MLLPYPLFRAIPLDIVSLYDQSARIYRAYAWLKKRAASHHMEHQEFTNRDGDNHIIIKPEHPPHPGKPVSVPEGGSTLLFILAALTAIAWAATKRYGARSDANAAPARITS
jgi:hypothetical protein